MKKYLRFLSPARLIAAAMIIMLLPGLSLLSRPSEQYLRSRVVMLKSDHGRCSGEQVKAPSGVSYILTAAHCRILEQNGSIMVESADGKELLRRVIAEDTKSDLLLLEGLPNMEGISISQREYGPEEHVRTFTHGHGLPTYKTEGHLITDQRILVGLYPIMQPSDRDRCESQSKSKVLDAGFFGEVCVLDVVETITTAMIVPGSSGGMVVNDAGELAGVVSAGDGVFGCLVTIDDIHNFVDNY